MFGLELDLSDEELINKLIHSSLNEAFNLQRWNILRWVKTLRTGDLKKMDELNHSAPNHCISFNSNIVEFLHEVRSLCGKYCLNVDVFHNGGCSGKLLFQNQPQYALFFSYEPDIYIGQDVIYNSVIRVRMSLDENVYRGNWEKI